MSGNKLSYVYGFMTDFDMQRFVMIDKAGMIKEDRGRKVKLLWQGVGGVVEDQPVLSPEDGSPDGFRFETPHQAMVREFQEECGTSTVKKAWHCFHIKEFKNSKIYCFVNFAPAATLEMIVKFAPDQEGKIGLHSLTDVLFDNQNYTYDVAYILNLLITEMRRGFLLQLDPEGINSSGKN